MNYKEVYRQTIDDIDHVIQFGKYKSKSLEFVFDVDPQYVLFCVDRGIFELSSELWTEFYIRNPWAE